MIKRLLLFIILAVMGCALMVTRPAPSDFASWYIKEYSINTPLNSLMETVIEEQTEYEDYMIAATFTYQDRIYVGVASHIFGSHQVQTLIETTADTVQETINELFDQN